MDRRGIVVGASVPETSVHEHNDSGGNEAKIGPSSADPAV